MSSKGPATTKSKQKDSETIITIGSVGSVRNVIYQFGIRELIGSALGVIATVVGAIFTITLFFEFLQASPLLINLFSGVISIAIISYAALWLYRRQQKQRKLVEDVLKDQEQEFLTEIDHNLSKLLSEKVG